MNKSALYFVAGLITGGAAGATATYFLVKEKFAAENDEDMEAYSEHCEERIAKYREENEDLKKKLGVIKDPVAKVAEDPEEAKIARNEGVKKYHHDNGLSSKYGENHIFEKIEDKPEKKEEKKLVLINEIDEDEFMNRENGYEKQTIDVFLGDDRYMCGIWGYQTDNEEDVEKKWNKKLNELVGSYEYDELLDTTRGKEDGIGLLYVRNESLMIDFELVIHDNREEDEDIE